jgi:hypothetical protein
MKITGWDVRDGDEFELTADPANVAQGTFIALLPGEARVSRRLTDLFGLPDSTPVIANWHGQRRTDSFATSIAALRVARRWCPRCGDVADHFTGTRCPRCLG